MFVFLSLAFAKKILKIVINRYPYPNFWNKERLTCNQWMPVKLEFKPQSKGSCFILEQETLHSFLVYCSVLVQSKTVSVIYIAYFTIQLKSLKNDNNVSLCDKKTTIDVACVYSCIYIAGGCWYWLWFPVWRC